MKKMLFAFAVVLTATSLAFADYASVITEVDNGNPDFQTFIVGLQVDDEGGITMISDIDVTGPSIVQMKYYVGFPVNDWSSTTGPLSSSATAFLFDTHILDLVDYSITGEGLEINGTGWSEDNDSSLTTELGGTLGQLEYGIGDLYLTDPGSSTMVAIKAPVPNLNMVDFIQVCVPTGSDAIITGSYSNANRYVEGLPSLPFTVHLVPEPSTIVMFVMGLLCLVGYRLRRK